jgi:hypothetical protein
VDLRSDQYDDKAFTECRDRLKQDLRDKGHYVWEEKYVPRNAAIAQDEDWQHHLTIDWGNSWDAWWRNSKDRLGLWGRYVAWN